MADNKQRSKSRNARGKGGRSRAGKNENKGRGENRGRNDAQMENKTEY